MLQQQHAATGSGQRVGSGQAGQPAADHDLRRTPPRALSKKSLGIRSLDALCGVSIGHEDAACHRADDADESLVCAADEEVFQVSRAVALFFGAP